MSKMNEPVINTDKLSKVQVKGRQMTVLLMSMFIFTLGFGIIVPVIGYYTKSMGAGAFEIGLLMASMSAMQFLFAPLGGRISDRIGRKPVILVGLLGSFNSIGRVLGPSMGGFAYVISMLLPYLGSAAIALASMAVARFWAPGGTNKNILAAPTVEDREYEHALRA